jgi:hypothetical protein
MKHSLSSLAAAALLGGCAAPGPPDAIVYLAASPAENQRAAAAIMLCLAQPDCPTLLGERLQCGPFLWRQLQHHRAVAGLGAAVPYKPDPAMQLEGRSFRGRKQLRAFWSALTETLPLPARAQIRKLTEQECRIYWALRRSKIQEPVFVVEAAGSKLLMQLLGTPEGFRLVFVENLQNVVIRD